jgi:hypothetical protein
LLARHFMRATMLAQRVSQSLPILNPKPKLREEPRLACAIAMPGSEQIIRNLVALDDQLVGLGNFIWLRLDDGGFQPAANKATGHIISRSLHAVANRASRRRLRCMSEQLLATP